MVISKKILKTLSFSIWSFFIAVGVYAAPLDNEKAAALTRQGQEYFKSCRYEDAQSVYDIAANIFREINDLSGQGSVFRYRGDIFFRTGDNANALSMYETALSIYLKAHDKAGQASVFIGMGKVYMRTGENKKALELYEESLSVSKERNDAAGQGNAYQSIGDLYLRKRDFPKAIKMYNLALSFYQSSNDFAGLGSVYRNLGEIHMRMGDNAKARTFLEKAMTFCRQANDFLCEGDVYRSIGEINYFISDNAGAMEMYNKALPFFLKAREPVGQGHIYTRMGEIYLCTGNNEKALEMFTQALPLYQQASDPIGLGDVYFDTGRLNKYKCDYQSALEMYEKALPYYSKAEEPCDMGNVYQGMANVYWRVGDYQKSLAYCAKALHYYVQANSPLGKANAYWTIGEAYFYLGDYTKAMEKYSKALPLYQKVGNPIGQGVVYQDIAEIYFKSGKYQKALDMNEKALPFFIQANSLIDQIRVYRSLGDIYAKTGKNKQSLQMYDKALDISRKIEDIDAEAYILVSKAAVLGRTGKISEAAGLYEEGMTRFERVRRQSGSSEMKKSYMAKVYDQYEDATIFMIKNLYIDKAFKYAEAMKARVFLDQLAEGPIKLNKGIDPDLKMKRDGIENRLSLIQKQIIDESQRKKPNEAKITALKSEYAGTEEELEAVKKEIQRKNPLYASVQYNEPITVKELQTNANVLKEKEAILEYFVSRAGIYCFVITTDAYEIVKLKVTRDELEKDTKLFLKSFENTVKKNALQKFNEEQAHKLYSILILPVEKYIKDKSLIIVPDGILTRLPFEALMLREKGKDIYLLEKYSIKYVQSASVLEILRTKYKEEGRSDMFVGFGDPVYDYEAFKAGKPEKGSAIKGSAIKGIKQETSVNQLTKNRYFRTGGKLNRLEESGKEVEEIVKILENNNKEKNKYLRLDAREENAKSESMEKYGYIHFSAHGALDDDFQAIVLSQIPDSKEDGMLTLGKIMNCSYNARLVVLSACETGLGKTERGEGVTGLTRAVMYAGTPAVVVSLWSVADEQTKELMVRFYKNIIEKGMMKEEALRAAKIEMLDIGYRRFPFYWSAFVMYGE